MTSQRPSLVEQLSTGMLETGCNDAPTLIGVSGGADSIALLRGWLELRRQGRLTHNPTVIHVDHALRADSAADAKWVSELAGSFGLDCIVERLPVLNTGSTSGTIEEVARRERYDRFVVVARSHGISQVLVAHTADDQAETVLHHILRGSGLAGVSGIPPTRELDPDVTLRRPLLQVSRRAIEEWLTETNQSYRVDPTNRSMEFTRNRIRHDLLPTLAEQYNTRIHDALCKLARTSRDAQDVVSEEAGRLLAEAIIERTPSRCRLDCKILSSHHRHLIRETFVELWKLQAWPRQSMTFDHWNALASLTEQRGGCTLPSAIQAKNHRRVLTLSAATASTEP